MEKEKVVLVLLVMEVSTSYGLADGFSLIRCAETMMQSMNDSLTQLTQ